MPFLLVKVSVVISAGDSFCCNYATDLCSYNMAIMLVKCCILAGSQVLLSVTGKLVDLSVTIIMQVTVSVVVMLKMRSKFLSQTPPHPLDFFG